MIKLMVNGDVLTVKLDDEQMMAIKTMFTEVTGKEIRRQIRAVMKEEAKAE